MSPTERGTDWPPSISLESVSFQYCSACQAQESICSLGVFKNIDSSWKRFNTNLGTFSFSFPWWQLSWQHETKHFCCLNDALKKKRRWWSHLCSCVWVGMSGRDVARARLCDEPSRGWWAYQTASLTVILGLGSLLCVRGTWVLAHGHFCSCK